MLWFSWLSDCDLLSGKNTSSMSFSCSVMSNSLRHTMAYLSFAVSQSLIKLPSIESVMPSNHLILCHLFLMPSIFLSIKVFSNELAFMLPWTAAHLAYLSFTISQSLLKLTSIELVMPSNPLVLCHPLLLLPSIFPSIKVFSNELALCIRWPKYWSFSFSISPSNEYSGLISSRIDWFDLLLVQGILKSLLQHQDSKATTSSTCWGFYFCRRAQGYFYVYPLRQNQDPTPQLLYCFLTVPPLTLYPLPSIISSCPSLPFRTQEGSGRLESIPYKEETEDTEGLGCPGGQQGLAWFHCQRVK